MEKDFLTELNEIKKQYQEEQNKQEKLNIFRALHKVHDEKFLHSRFIAYLLSPTSKHRMGDAFLRKFIEEAKINFDLDGDIEIYPNEKNKSEKYNIDILIVNKTTKQVIIIENKINAKDSNHKINQDQDFQFHSSESKNSNNEIAQLKAYFEDFKENNDLEIRYIDDKEAREKIQLVYLTLNRKQPSLKDQLNEYILTLIDYRTEIKHWIKNCINDKATDHFLEEILRQYLDVTIQITNDVKRAEDLKELISKNYELAVKNIKKITEMDDFRHVKWHTVFEFWNELTVELEKDSKVEIIKRITNDEITKQTHKETPKEGRKRVDRKSYGIVIKLAETLLYITNDNNNGLTIGFPSSSSDEKPKEHWRTIDEGIKFSDFTNNATFEKINKKKRKDLIDKTIEKIKEFTGKDLNNEA